VKIRPVLADTGRLTPASSTVNLLNAGWTATTAVPLPGGGWTVPAQALAVFIEAPWDQLNKLHTMVVDLISDDGKPVYFMPGPTAGAPEVRIQHRVVVAPVPGAPSGTPGLACVFLDLPAGNLWIPGPGHRFIWKIAIGDVTEEIGFWVQNPPGVPTIGRPAAPPAQPGA